jgi:hypothetical protein
VAGQSTFYVELSETAAMLHQATPWWVQPFLEQGCGTGFVGWCRIVVRTALQEVLSHW